MVLILYTRIQQKLHDIAYQQYMNMLPVPVQNKIKRFHVWQDAHRSLFGNLLLAEGLREMRLTNQTLENLRYTEYNRPYLQDSIFLTPEHT